MQQDYLESGIFQKTNAAKPCASHSGMPSELRQPTLRFPSNPSARRLIVKSEIVFAAQFTVSPPEMMTCDSERLLIVLGLDAPRPEEEISRFVFALLFQWKSLFFFVLFLRLGQRVVFGVNPFPIVEIHTIFHVETRKI